MYSNQIIETWEIHNRINLYLLTAIEESWLNDMAESKGRNVGEQFGHIHNVRLMWIKTAHSDLLDGLTKIEKKDLSKLSLAEELTKSSLAISTLLEEGLLQGKIKGFKPHPVAFMGYLISHESHHRGQIMLALKQSGHSVGKKIQFGLWEWGVR